MTVVMRDSAAVNITGDEADCLIHDSDIMLVINELRSAGAEAISLNGERITVAGEFRLCIFLSGAVGNAALAAFLTWLGQMLGIPLYLAAVVVFGTRMFQNFAEIRRQLLTSKQKKDKIEQDIVSPSGRDTK